MTKATSARLDRTGPAPFVQVTIALRPDGAYATWVPIPFFQRGCDVRVSVMGEADLCTAWQLQAELADVVSRHPATVVVDLGGLSFCDSHGLDALHEVLARARTARVRMSWQAASPLLQWMHAVFPPGGHEEEAPPAPGSGVVAYPRPRADPARVAGPGLRSVRVGMAPGR